MLLDCIFMGYSFYKLEPLNYLAPKNLSIMYFNCLVQQMTKMFLGRLWHLSRAQPILSPFTLEGTHSLLWSNRRGGIFFVSLLRKSRLFFRCLTEFSLHNAKFCSDDFNAQSFRKTKQNKINLHYWKKRKLAWELKFMIASLKIFLRCHYCE